MELTELQDHEDSMKGRNHYHEEDDRFTMGTGQEDLDSSLDYSSGDLQTIGGSLAGPSRVAPPEMDMADSQAGFRRFSTPGVVEKGPGAGTAAVYVVPQY